MDPRITPIRLYVMLALADGPRHGYALLQSIEEAGAGRIRPGPSSIYYALDRLERSGLIEETVAPEPETGADERRRYYRLTARGRTELREEASLLADIVDRARARGIVS